MSVIAIVARSSLPLLPQAARLQQFSDRWFRRVGVAKYSRLRQEFQEKEDKMREVHACRSTSAAACTARDGCACPCAFSSDVCRRWTR